MSGVGHKRICWHPVPIMLKSGAYIVGHKGMVVHTNGRTAWHELEQFELCQFVTGEPIHDWRGREP